MANLPSEPDPLPADRFIGETCSFDYGEKRLTGRVESKLWVGYAGTRIPNYHLAVRGQSGKLLTVDMWLQYATLRR